MYSTILAHTMEIINAFHASQRTKTVGTTSSHEEVTGTTPTADLIELSSTSGKEMETFKVCQHRILATMESPSL